MKVWDQSYRAFKMAASYEMTCTVCLTVLFYRLFHRRNNNDFIRKEIGKEYEKGKTLSDSSGVSIPWIFGEDWSNNEIIRMWQSVSLQTWMVLNGETVQN